MNIITRIQQKQTNIDPHVGNTTDLKQRIDAIKSSFDQLLALKNIGFTKIPDRSYLFDESSALALDLTKKYDQFVIIGIGGSSMGARAIAEISHSKNIHFLDNVDAIEFENVWASVKTNLKKTAFVVVSKSGSTIEILWNYSLIENLMTASGLDLIGQSYFITEKVDNPLAALAKKHHRPHLEIPVDVGGRFSVLTPVGLLIAGLCGLSISDMKTGAAEAVKNKEAIVEACDLYLQSFKRNEIITLFWFYHSNYRWFGGWLQQLWAESLGKKTNRLGQKAPDFSTPMSAIGACDQHSILQQVAHGTKNKFVSFFSFSSAEKSQHTVQSNVFNEIQFMNNRPYGDLIHNQALATEKALFQNDVSTAFFHIDDTNKSRTLGYLFMYFQLIVGTLGEHENINAFDQPGVTLGKDLTIELLKK